MTARHDIDRGAKLLYYVAAGVALAVGVLIAAAVLSGAAAGADQNYPAAHDNYLDQGRCRPIQNGEIGRCHIRHGRQWVRAEDGSPHLAIAVWVVGRDRYLIARDYDTGRVRAHPSGGSGVGGPVVFTDEGGWVFRLRPADALPRRVVRELASAKASSL